MRMQVKDVGDDIIESQQRIIVLVEDDATLISMFSDAFALSTQWQLHVFSDGETAKERIRDMQVHLIILDIGLPALDGASLYRMLRGHSNTKDTPILVITGSQEWELHRMGLQPGYLLQKPFSIHELFVMVQALLP